MTEYEYSRIEIEALVLENLRKMLPEYVIYLKRRQKRLEKKDTSKMNDVKLNKHRFQLEETKMLLHRINVINGVS